MMVIDEENRNTSKINNFDDEREALINDPNENFVSFPASFDTPQATLDKERILKYWDNIPEIQLWKDTIRQNVVVAMDKYMDRIKKLSWNVWWKDWSPQMNKVAIYLFIKEYPQARVKMAVYRLLRANEEYPWRQINAMNNHLIVSPSDYFSDCAPSCTRDIYEYDFTIPLYGYVIVFWWPNTIQTQFTTVQQLIMKYDQSSNYMDFRSKLSNTLDESEDLTEKTINAGVRVIQKGDDLVEDALTKLDTGYGVAVAIGVSALLIGGIIAVKM